MKVQLYIYLYVWVSKCTILVEHNIKSTLSPVEINFSHCLFAFDPCVLQVK